MEGVVGTRQHRHRLCQAAPRAARLSSSRLRTPTMNQRGQGQADLTGCRLSLASASRGDYGHHVSGDTQELTVKAGLLRGEMMHSPPRGRIPTEGLLQTGHCALDLSRPPCPGTSAASPCSLITAVSAGGRGREGARGGPPALSWLAALPKARREKRPGTFAYPNYGFLVSMRN